jgi:transcriptional regulator with GAF, ATPase, and Fis domain
MTIERVARRDPVEPERDLFPEIDGTSGVIRRLKTRMRFAAADPDVTVLILGESGTGKERVARAIHRASPRGRAPFVVINCAGLSATLIEDELFGHVRGAFTGAVADRPGPFERAAGGTVFLDEIGDLAPELQMKLLRALQERTVQRLGARDETAIDVRVVAATNVDLARAVAAGRFREDLYYRLRVYELIVPPLRRRGAGDLRALAIAIVDRFAERRHRRPPPIEPAVFDRLLRHTWPGNVRELENALECMIVDAVDDVVLRTRHLPDDVGAASLSRDEAALPPVADLVSALERHEWKTVRTAKALGISRHQLHRLLTRHGIRRPPGLG